MLAGLPQNPLHADPVASPERAAKRQRWVLKRMVKRMVKTGAVTEAAAAHAADQPLRLRNGDAVTVHGRATRPTPRASASPSRCAPTTSAPPTPRCAAYCDRAPVSGAFIVTVSHLEHSMDRALGVGIPRAAIVLSISALAWLPHTASAQATVINFAVNACTGTGTRDFYFDPFDTQGFRFTGTYNGQPLNAWATPCTGSAYYAGTTTFYPNNVGNVTTLTRIAGGAFAISSIDLAPLYGPNSAQTVTFTGSLQTGGTVAQTFAIPAPASAVVSLTTFNFAPTFTNLSSLQMSANVQPYYQFTNLRLVMAVPEASSLAMLVGGLLLVGGATLRRRHRAAARPAHPT